MKTREEIRARFKAWRDRNLEHCRAYAHEYYAAHKEQHDRSQKRFNASLPVKERKRRDRMYNLKKKYGITPEQFDAMLAAQGGVCAVCKGTHGEHGRPLFMDHKHGTKQTRGILCVRCNLLVGFIEKNEATILACEEYLRKWDI